MYSPPLAEAAFGAPRGVQELEPWVEEVCYLGSAASMQPVAVVPFSPARDVHAHPQPGDGVRIELPEKRFQVSPLQEAAAYMHWLERHILGWMARHGCFDLW